MIIDITCRVWEHNDAKRYLVEIYDGLLRQRNAAGLYADYGYDITTNLGIYTFRCSLPMFRMQANTNVNQPNCP